jgi:signal transduction histidine kinase
MNSGKRIWDFLLRHDRQLTRSIYKKAILRGQLTLLALSVGVIYIIIDYVNDIYFNLPYYCFLIAFSSITLFLNRKGHFKMANYVFLILLNGLIYVFASNDTYRSGVYLYFIVCSLTSLTLCGYEQLRTGLLFCMLSLLLFLLAYIFKVYPLMPHAEVPESYVTIAFTTNFIISLVTTAILLFFLLDINYRAEEELSKNNELLTKTNSELDRFVYSASHDLRAPLSSLLGLINISKLAVKPEELKLHLEMMTGRVLHLDSFIKEIINYSRNSRLEVLTGSVNLLSLITDVVDSLRFSEHAANIKIEILVSPNLQIIADANRLKVVLTNLISNSIRYADFTKKNPFIKIQAFSTDNETRIQVTDNGLGIAKEHQNKIFDMFYRASENSTGSGLGLYIVMETLTRMGGNIEMTSEHGSGSTFEIILPNQKG